MNAKDRGLTVPTRPLQSRVLPFPLHRVRTAGGEQRAGRDLSRRESEILALIMLGKTDRQIADDLFIARITVSNHVAHILDKLDVPNRAAAAAVAARMAVLDTRWPQHRPGNDESA